MNIEEQQINTLFNKLFARKGFIPSLKKFKETQGYQTVKFNCSEEELQAFHDLYKHHYIRLSHKERTDPATVKPAEPQNLTALFSMLI